MIGVDFGGTRIKVADVVGSEAQRSVSIPTQASHEPGRILREIAEVIREIDPNPEAVGFAIPGEVDENGRCWRLPNVPGFEGVEIGQRLATSLGCPVRVENDGTAATLAEILFGHGREYRSFVMLTLGTGVGGGIAIDGQPRRGRNGFAGEVGHIAIRRSPDAPACGCGERGCLESFCGTAALLRSFEALGGKATEVHEIGESAAQGDERAREVFQQMGHHLALGVASIQALLDVDAFVFAGGISNALEWIEPQLRKSLRQHTFAAPLGQVPLLVSQLGDRAGVVGAAYLPSRLAGPGA